MPRGYPVNLIVADRPCLVVGGGPVAARKAAGLLDCGARVHVVAPTIGSEMDALAARWPDHLTVEQRAYAPPEAGGYRLVLSTGRADHDRADLDVEVAADADAAGVWVNVADDPVHSRFHVPALVRQGPVAVAVSTEGTSPALAAWLRDRLADGELGPIGPEVGVLARLLSEQRDEIRAAGRSTEAVNWRTVLDTEMLELVRGGRVDEVRERLHTCLS